MKLRLIAIAAGMVVALTAASSAETLKGTVTNATTGKPAAGVEVTLISLAQGMTEAGSTKADAAGRFSFTIKDSGTPHLVRANHQNVGYFKMAPPGTTSVELQIYDAANKLEGISNTVDVMRFQSDGSTLQVMELFAVQNLSSPARTLAGERTFEFVLPEGAVIDQASARGPNGNPLNTAPEPVSGKKNRYAFSFPLRPGETQFEVAYHLPYTGQIALKPTLLNNVQHFVAMLPRSMQLAASGANFQPMSQADSTANVQVATNVRAGDPLALNISGAGLLEDDSQQGGPAQAQSGMSSRTGPGGGLGNPIGSPDPLSRYRWPLLGFFAVVLVGGGLFVMTRRAPMPDAEEALATATAPARSMTRPEQATPPQSSLLLEAMKEELFQLELDRQQGRISEEEYRQTKAALDQTFKRAVKRASKQ
ncbi:MAG: carboxypeptidase regulatory-like domain-containing protein [Terriglobales bacterium]